MGTLPPVITLTGPDTITLIIGEEYVDLGATAQDNIDGDITTNITIDDNNVNTMIAGTYEVTYDVSDSSENQAEQVIRTVIVITASEATQNLVDLVEGKNLANNVEKSLLGPLKQVSKVLDDDNPDNDLAACDKLTDFVDNVNSKESSGKISSADAEEFRESATQIQNALGC